MLPLLLASASPRRRELLSLLDFPFTVQSPDADETLPGNIPPCDAVLLLSRRKADAVRRGVSRPSLILAADTVVAYGDKIFGKPASQQEAFSTLRILSGRTHEVYTGVTLCSPEKTVSFYECTRVTFYPLSDREILDYTATGEPMDKAGAYGIQGRGALLVQKIEGDYFNVVGLPIARVSRELSALL